MTETPLPDFIRHPDPGVEGLLYVAWTDLHAGLRLRLAGLLLPATPAGEVAVLLASLAEDYEATDRWEAFPLISIRAEPGWAHANWQDALAEVDRRVEHARADARALAELAVSVDRARTADLRRYGLRPDVTALRPARGVTR